MRGISGRRLQSERLQWPSREDTELIARGFANRYPTPTTEPIRPLALTGRPKRDLASGCEPALEWPPVSRAARVCLGDAPGNQRCRRHDDVDADMIIVVIIIIVICIRTSLGECYGESQQQVATRSGIVNNFSHNRCLLEWVSILRANLLPARLSSMRAPDGTHQGRGFQESARQTLYSQEPNAHLAEEPRSLRPLMETH